MARSVGNRIPGVMRPLFAAADLEALEGFTFLLLSSTVEGWPHLAMLSVGEVIAVGERDLRLALWRGSTAAANLERSGRTTLALVYEGAGYSLRCSARPGPDLRVENGRQAYFELRVEDVLEDVAPYALLTSGVTFRLKNPADVLPRWRQTIAALRER